MADVVWTEPALLDMEDVADYIALDNPAAARRLVHAIFAATDRLERFPQSGRVPPELSDSVYREVVVTPCRIFYRLDGERVLILHVMREERLLRAYLLN